MAHNPLLGNRISLISKKNIRYEGTLYSINEADATVALQNVRSYGTEGREKLDPSGSSTFVPPQDAVHPYLVFRGCDIKDLHVHENTSTAPPPAAAAAAAAAPTETTPPPPPPPAQSTDAPTPPTSQPSTDPPETSPKTKDVPGSPARPPGLEEDKKEDEPALVEEEKQVHEPKPKPPPAAAEQQPVPQEKKVEPKPEPRATRGPRKQPMGGRPRRNNTAPQIGTGASLLTRKERGVVDSGAKAALSADFDFESNLANFEKETEENKEESAYEKDDFFDLISCDALDREAGIDNRLRGAAERNLNTETFGAVALNGQRRYRRYRGGGGRGRGRGRGRGYGYGGRSGGRGGGGGGRGRGGRGRGRFGNRSHGTGIPTAQGS